MGAAVPAMQDGAAQFRAAPTPRNAGDAPNRGLRRSLPAGIRRRPAMRRHSRRLQPRRFPGRGVVPSRRGRGGAIARPSQLVRWEVVSSSRPGTWARPSRSGRAGVVVARPGWRRSLVVKPPRTWSRGGRGGEAPPSGATVVVVDSKGTGAVVVVEPSRKWSGVDVRPWCAVVVVEPYGDVDSWGRGASAAWSWWCSTFREC